MTKILLTLFRFGVIVVLAYTITIGRLSAINTPHFPVGFLLAPGWWFWICFTGHKWKERILATFGLGVAAFGWWGCYLIEGYMIHIEEGGHFDNNYWGAMRMATEQVGEELYGLGLMLLAFADYLRTSKRKSFTCVTKEDVIDKSPVWPPPPKQPQR